MATKNIQMIPPGYTDIVHPETNSAIVIEKTNKKFVTDAEKTKLSNLSGTNTGDETTTTLGTKINGATAKTTPVNADMLPLMDSASSNVVKKVSWANVKATLKTYFDTLYNNYVHPTTSGNKHIPSGGSANQVLKYSSDGTAVWGTDANTVTTINGKTGAIAKADITALGIPAQDTTYSTATTSVNGLMSSSDKTKLNGVATNANNYSHPNHTGDVTSISDGATVIASKAVSNAKLADMSSNTIKGRKDTAGVPQDLSASEVRAILNVADGANKYVHPTTSGNKHIPSGGSANQVLKYSADGTAVWGTDSNTITTINGKTGAIVKADVVALGIPAQDTTYVDATTSASGLMSSGDKTKLNGIATNANNYSHPTTAGNKHIPTGGASGQILKYSASGTAVWGADNDTITTVNGKTGAISKSDIVALGIPAQDTVYTHPTTAGNKHIPTGGASNQILKYSASGTAVWANESVTPVVNNLTSTSTTSALSANQGKVLNDLISNISVEADTIPLSPETATLYGLTGDDATVDKALAESADKIGDIKIFGYKPDNTWLLCDGQSVSKSIYAMLYNVVGDAFRTLDSWIIRTSGFGTTQIDGVAYGNGLWVIVGDSGKLATSTDGISWTLRTSSFGSSKILRVAYGNGLWVIGGAAGLLATSTDGVSWTQGTSNFGGVPIYGVAYGNGLWVIGGANGALATSTDGISWTQRTSNFDTHAIHSVAYGNGQWVIVGANGLLATSTDGISWTLRTSSFATNYINDAAYGNGLWVIVGAAGLLATSTDGVSWTQGTSNFDSNQIRRVVYGNGLWVTVGARGLLDTSTDGISWTLRTSNFGTTTTITGTAYGNGQWVIVGGSGKLAIEQGDANMFIIPSHAQVLPDTYVKGAI